MHTPADEIDASDYGTMREIRITTTACKTGGFVARLVVKGPPVVAHGDTELAAERALLRALGSEPAGVQS